MVMQFGIGERKLYDDRSACEVSWPMPLLSVGSTAPSVMTVECYLFIGLLFVYFI